MAVGENHACIHRWVSWRLSWIDHCLNAARTRGRPYRSAERGRTRTNRRIIPPFELSDNEVPRRQPRRWPAEPRGRTAGVRVSAEGSPARNSQRAASAIPTNHMTVGDEVRQMWPIGW